MISDDCCGNPEVEADDRRTDHTHAYRSPQRTHAQRTARRGAKVPVRGPVGGEHQGDYRRRRRWFGSFYNHFDSKEQLFDEAVQSALQVYSEMRDHIVARYDDPAEIFAVSFRLTGRLQRQIPEMVRVVLHSGMGVMLRDQGIAPRARREIIAPRKPGASNRWIRTWPSWRRAGCC